MRRLTDTFSDLLEYYISYYETPFELRHPGLTQERRRLLQTEGEIYREPFLEAAARYASSGRTLHSAAAELDLSSEFADFAHIDLFTAPELYEHQFEALKTATCKESTNNFVVTAGTGSGKTESFLLPVIEQLVRESASWPKNESSPLSWWNDDDWVPQRAGEARMAGIRCIVLYPMNALVEDQLRRLRVGLDSQQARAWLDVQRGGNRFYFGRYTGRTPVPGKVGGELATGELRRAMKEQARVARRVKTDDVRRYFFPQLDGAEMRSRWDMIDRPPDILITNYSMLNVMLMRSREENIFECTREWLDADNNHVLTLVVDELHMYRGTAGTEVGLLLRNLRHRLGLHTNDRLHQLRVFAASASLSGNEDGVQFAREFFGDGRFEASSFLAGKLAQVDTLPPAGLSAHHKIISEFPTAWDASEDETARRGIVQAMREAVGETPGNADQPARQALAGLANAVGLVPTVLGAFSVRDQDGQLRPTSFRIVSDRMFPSASTGLDADAQQIALQGVLRMLAEGERPDGSVLLPLRGHFFFRNIRGAWACSNPACPAVEPSEREGRTVGKLYLQPQLRCVESCGARVLELLYCENCGEVFLGGYRSPSGASTTAGEYLLPDLPNLESLPDFAEGGRTDRRYLLYWPSVGQPQDSKWQRAGLNSDAKASFQFVAVSYEPKTGEVTRSLSGRPTGWVFRINRRREDEELNALPTKCPHCNQDTERPTLFGDETLDLPQRLRSPIRTMGTGFERVSQVLSDALVRSIRREGGKHKLVVFSDSRQDAAKLSTGLEASHYQDLVRQLLLESMLTLGGDLSAYIRRLESGEQSDAAMRYRATHPEEALALQTVLRMPEDASDDDRHRASELLSSVNGPWPITDIRDAVMYRLLDLGVNPGGPNTDLQDYLEGRERRPWTDLFDFEKHPPTVRSHTDAAAQLRQKIREQLDDQFRFTLFARTGRDLETLGLGWPTFSPAVGVQTSDRTQRGELIRQAADSSIRILGLRYRINDGEHRQADEMPGYLRNYLERVAIASNERPQDFINAVEDVLINSRAMTSGYLLNVQELYVRRPGGQQWVCGTCRRVHLHPSGNVCSNTQCRNRLNESTALVTENCGILDRDYFEVLATSGDEFRLHCEELTGQTDLDDSLRRQRLFQDVTLEDADMNPRDVPTVDTVDLLSVTTTMEAGVDIGGLQGVVMSNMPPQRFNYQQRVGRAGRRGDAVSVALTICRGRTHDDFYFNHPERITGDLPPQPYIDLRRREIVERVVNAESLRMAFSELGMSLVDDEGLAVDLGHSTHGQFGAVDDWETYAEAVRAWLREHREDIAEAVDAFLLEAPSSLLAQRDDLISNAADRLADRIDEELKKPLGFQTDLSELLANRGLLPMFGFPTRSRFLFQRRPTRWPPKKNIVDRDLDIAISQFAPEAQTVKDKAIYTSVGVVGYEKEGIGVRTVDDPLAASGIVGQCRRCHALTDEPSDHCTVCGEGAAPNGKFSTHTLCEPAGFRTSYRRGKPYTGQFDWTPRASRARLSEGAEVGDPATAAGLNIITRTGPSRVFAINDNNGEDFTFYEYPRDLDSRPGRHGLGDGWVVPDAFDRKPEGLELQRKEVRALASITKTDVLLIGLAKRPVGIDLRPTRLEARAAWYSFGFMLRRAAADLLDIDENELRVGLRVRADAGKEQGEIFISDALENGAGYSTHLAKPEQLRELLERVNPKPEGPVAKAFREHRQAGKTCDSSCHDCLRDYSNMAFHGLLDWRLALDLAELVTGSALSEDRWLSRSQETQRQLCEGFGWEGALFDQVSAVVRRDGTIVLLTHPLWSTTDFGPTLADAFDAASQRTDRPIEFASLFDAIRRPGNLVLGDRS